MTGKERRRPVGVRAAEERVRVPAFEIKRDRIRNGGVGVHSSKDFHDLLPNI
jgi:hypothetical protein